MGPVWVQTLEQCLLYLVSIQLIAPASGASNAHRAGRRQLLVSIQLIAPASGADNYIMARAFIQADGVSIQLIAPASGALGMNGSGT